MRRVVIFLMLVLPCVARAEVPGYVDTTRVRSTASEPKRLDAEFRADQAARNQKINEVGTLAQKAKPADANAAWAAAVQVQREQNDAIRKKAEDADAAFVKGLTSVLAKLRAARHVPVTAGAGVILAPGVDLTKDAIALWDQADAEGMAAELAKARAENAALKAKASDKTTTKGTSP